MDLRTENRRRLGAERFDVVVIGSGINGASAAAALAASGAKVALIDRADFASQASSNSSNLIWGGIKYLESYEFGLVNKLCQARNRLLRACPSSVKEVRFLTTIQRGFRKPSWLIYCGALLYWLMGRFATQAPTLLSATKIGDRESTIDLTEASGGFEYSDCYLPDGDARFVWRFVQICLRHGGAAANYIESTGAQRDAEGWVVEARDCLDSSAERAPIKIRGKVLINACGPNLDQYNAKVAQTTDNHHAYSKGAHLVVRRLTKERRVLAFFASDGRLFFVTPMGSRSCIGTTDTRLEQPSDARVTDEDRQFILNNANDLLSLDEPLTEADVIAERCGVRPLVIERGGGSDDWLQMSRKHVLEVDQQAKHISIFGGKLTDCLNIGEEILHEVARLGLSIGQPPAAWYAEPGQARQRAFVEWADRAGIDQLTDPRSREPLSKRLWRRYGDDAMEIARLMEQNPEQAKVLFEGSGYTYAELGYAAKKEMITSLDDLFRRRSDIALTVTAEQRDDDLTLQRINSVLFGSAPESTAVPLPGADSSAVERSSVA